MKNNINKKLILKNSLKIIFQNHLKKKLLIKLN